MDGAAKYLRSLPYVDTRYIAASGHSNSGVLGYYLFTHSNSFTAMSIGAGMTDMISHSLSLNTTDGESKLLGLEIGYDYVPGPGNLWKNKKVWIDHTAVLHADQVSCPILMFHNKKDGVPFEQAVEIFIALRRLEKPVWWLQYDKGGHTLSVLQDLRDFTIRYTQYFDHYLKDAPAPLWMTQGIPARLKQVITGYDFDPSGNCGTKENPCKVCNMWNKKWAKDSVATKREIEEKTKSENWMRGGGPPSIKQ
jgi:hypothetical protein